MFRAHFNFAQGPKILRYGPEQGRGIFILENKEKKRDFDMMKNKEDAFTTQ